MKVRFYPKSKKRESTVTAAISYKGNRYFIYTRENVDPRYWLGSRVSSRHPDANYVNSQLQRWEGVIKDSLKSLTRNLTAPTQDQLRAEVARRIEGSPKRLVYFIPWLEDFVVNVERSAGTKKQYRSVAKKLKEFDPDVRFEDVNLDYERRLKKYLRGYSVNYRGNVIKNLKAFMAESDKELEHGCEDYKKFKIEKEETSAVYLDVPELLRLRDLEFTREDIERHYPDLDSRRIGQKLASLPVIRDRFLIGAFTGLRVSDFKRLSGINIDGNKIRIEPYKGGKNEEVVIPIHPVVSEILDRGLPRVVSEQKINKHIKVICRIAGIVQKVEKSITRGGKVERAVFEKCDLVTTHTARRSFATNAYKSGVGSLQIMQITGHTTEKSFLKYIRFSREENADLLASHPFFSIDLAIK